MRVGLCAVWLGVGLTLAGCGDKGPAVKPTFKVTGKITVDGAPPGSPIQVECHNVAGMDQKMPSVSQCESKDDGSFEIATYRAGDGVPEGDYVLTFTWQEFQLMSRSYGGPDKLNGRYTDKDKSQTKFSVKNKSVALGEIKLTTKD